MSALLNLPPELRLQIYTLLLSRQPYHIYIDEYFAKDCQPEWIRLKQLMKFDVQLASDIKRLYWSTNTFMIPEVNVKDEPDNETLNWTNEHVQDDLKHLRHLQFGFSARCRSVRAGTTNPVCYNVVSIDVQRQTAQLSKSGRRGDGCDHVEGTIKLLRDHFMRMQRDNGDRLLKENDFWMLYQSCGN